jgi:hypothetical protein
MLLLRIKVDVILNNSCLTNEDKSFVRLSRQAFFMEFPVERLWLYFKIARNMSRSDLELNGVEDKFAKCEQFLPAQFHTRSA